MTGQGYGRYYAARPAPSQLRPRKPQTPASGRLGAHRRAVRSCGPKAAEGRLKLRYVSSAKQMGCSSCSVLPGPSAAMEQQQEWLEVQRCVGVDPSCVLRAYMCMSTIWG